MLDPFTRAVPLQPRPSTREVGGDGDRPHASPRLPRHPARKHALRPGMMYYSAHHMLVATGTRGSMHAGHTSSMCRHSHLHRRAESHEMDNCAGRVTLSACAMCKPHPRTNMNAARGREGSAWLASTSRGCTSRVLAATPCAQAPQLRLLAASAPAPGECAAPAAITGWRAP